MSAQKSMQLHMIEQKFDMYDRDGNGSIDKSELQALAARLGGPLTSSEAERWMVQLDKDGSGSIDKQEFIEFWTKRHPGAVSGAPSESMRLSHVGGSRAHGLVGFLRPFTSHCVQKSCRLLLRFRTRHRFCT